MPTTYQYLDPHALGRLKNLSLAARSVVERLDRPERGRRALGPERCQRRADPALLPGCRSEPLVVEETEAGAELVRRLAGPTTRH